MKKFKLFSFAVLFAIVIASSFTLAGCGETHKPEDVVGTYTAKTMQVIYNDNNRAVYNIDSENNESEIIKQLSQIVNAEYKNTRYTVTQNDNGYVFATQVLNPQTETFITTQSDSMEYIKQSDNEKVVLRGAGNIPQRDFYFENNSVYFNAKERNVNSDDFGNNTVLKNFMTQNNMKALIVRYFLNK